MAQQYRISGSRGNPLAAENRPRLKDVKMTDAVALVEVHRGPILESLHLGHAVVASADGGIVEAWGNPDKIILPRSSAKMLQALPLLESGAGSDLGDEQLALACASHAGEMRHVEKVAGWLSDLGLDENALACGPQASRNRDLRDVMIREEREPGRLFNNCSGKHAGFLAVARHLCASLDYVDPAHSVQVAVKDAFEDMCGETSPGHGIDGCSAPNYATSLAGLARAMARFAAAGDGGVRDKAAARLRDAMIAHPELVSGKGKCCAELMQSTTEPVAVKTGAEGVYVAILPKRKLGVALKISDGATRASQVAVAAILARLGVLDPDHPRITRPIRNWDGIVTGQLRPAPGLL